MPKTHTVTPGTMTTMAAAFQQAEQFMANQPNDLPPADSAPTDLPVVVVQPSAGVQIDGFLDFIDQLATTAQARRYVMWSAANSLNNYIIANLQTHIRSETRQSQEVNQDVEYLSSLGLDQTTIDRFNEQKALIDEMRANGANLVEQGYEALIPPIETAERLVNLRGYVAEKMKATAKTVRDLAQPISDSIAYRLSRTPSVDEGLVMRWFIACDGKVSVDELRRVAMRQQLSDRAQLLEQSGRIIDLAKDLAYRGAPSDAEVESLFDELPIHVQYKLLGGIVRTLNVAMEKEVAAFIRFNRLDSIANRTLIQSVLNGYIDAFGKFGSANADALIAYEERGSKLPTLEELLADKSV
jgi:hypothetical protein